MPPPRKFSKGQAKARFSAALGRAGSQDGSKSDRNISRTNPTRQARSAEARPPGAFALPALAPDGEQLAGLAIEPARSEDVERGRGGDEGERAPDGGVGGRAARGEAERGEVHRVAEHAIPDRGGGGGGGEDARARDHLARAEALDQAFVILRIEAARNAARGEQLDGAQRDAEDAEAER